MNNLATDEKSIPAILDSVKQLSLDYLDQLHLQKIGHDSLTPVLPDLPALGLGALKSIELFETAFLPSIVASSGSRYWGFVTGGTTPAAIAGDWLVSVFDQNPQALKGNGDVSGSLEFHTIQLMLTLFGLPDHFTGAFLSGATMSNFTGLATARQWLGEQQGYNVAAEGIKSSMKIYAATPHAASLKSLAMLGLGRNNINYVQVPAERECIDMHAFEQMISQHPDEPFILISSAGTVNTVDFDDMKAIATLKKCFKFWWHIDAAFGGYAACSPQYQYLVDGWEDADSITIDNHKWLNVPYDSAVIFTRKEHTGLQIQTFQNSNAPYLGDLLTNFSYLNYVPENSRRFRALPAWLTLMAYGKEGYKAIVENNISLAKQLGQRLEDHPLFKVLAPVRLNTVCFTTRMEADIPGLLKELNKRGKIFVTATLYKGQSAIRAALVNWRTRQEDVALAMEEIEAAYETINV